MATLCFEVITHILDDLPVYIAGNFNNWHPKDERFQMRRISGEKYTFCFPEDMALPQPLEYKYTKGGWGFVELDENGDATPNRTTSQLFGKIRDEVVNWRRTDLEYNPVLLPRIHTISENFIIPQLKRNRRVVALLPHNYHDSEKRYPVLYLHDAQNLFDENAPYGNWAIDKRLAKLSETGHADVIIIAIDHGEELRLQEFSPYETSRWGKGRGRQYVNFIAQTLKPYIDAHFRTLPQRENTGIGGSSMGGLVSIYAGLMYPDLFGKLMVFSPSLWVSQKIYFDAIEFFNPKPTKIYLYAGGKESSGMIPNLNHFKDTLERRGFDSGELHFEVSINPKGHHNEVHWGEEFPKAMKWLFY